VAIGTDCADNIIPMFFTGRCLVIVTPQFLLWANSCSNYDLRTYDGISLIHINLTLRLSRLNSSKLKLGTLESCFRKRKPPGSTLRGPAPPDISHKPSSPVGIGRGAKGVLLIFLKCQFNGFMKFVNALMARTTTVNRQR
jgi:hypothetical protein